MNIFTSKIKKSYWGIVLSLQKMYHIVCFDNTAEVEVVPTLWVRDGVCWWPPYKADGVNRAVKNMEEPNNTWAAYTARVLYTASMCNCTYNNKPTTVINQQHNTKVELYSKQMITMKQDRSCNLQSSNQICSQRQKMSLAGHQKERLSRNFGYLKVFLFIFVVHS